MVDAKVSRAGDLSSMEKALLFWASFLSLAAASFGFVFRVMIPGQWASAYEISLAEVGGLTGAALWPIAVTMIIFSLLVDHIGYRVSMFFAFALQAISVVLTVMADDVNTLWYACFAAGLGHGVVEAVINPLCASIYRDEKSKWLNILHAAWPAGIVGGGVAYLLLVDPNGSWEDTRWIFWVMLLPVLIYGVLFMMCRRFPVDERVEANVSHGEMLKEFGGLGFGLAATFLIYELSGQVGWDLGDNKLYICMALGCLVGLVAAVALKSKGHWMFFVLCLVMIPLATAELGTDAWIKTLMEPIMGNEYASWAIVFSAFIMMVLRCIAGIPLKLMSPPALLLFSSAFSIIGLFALSETSGTMIFGAFVIYAIGQTFYWPTMLGLVSEQFPKGGAMTLNTVSAMGLLTVGIFGFPFLGAVQDHYSALAILEKEPLLVEQVEAKEKGVLKEPNFFGVSYQQIDKSKILGMEEMKGERRAALETALGETSQDALKVASLLPLLMALAFGGIWFYFRMIGGYRPVLLESK
jgi:MFS family permease